MKKIYYKGKTIQRDECYEGEDITVKINRLLTTKEPIQDGAPLLFTEKKEGINPAYDIRTDRWELAQSTLDRALANDIAKSKDITIETNNTETKNTEKNETA